MGIMENDGAVTNPESSQTDCLSANVTLFWRVFIPVFGTVFLAGLTITLLIIPEEDLYLPFPALWLRISVSLILISWLVFVKRKLWQLKRIDANAQFLYVTNYWQTVRYPWTDVRQIDETKRMGRRIVHFQLLAPGRFGQTISILPADNFDELIEGFVGTKPD